MESLEHIKNLLNKQNQQHLLKFYDEISPCDQQSLLSEIENFDLPSFSSKFDITY